MRNIDEDDRSCQPAIVCVMDRRRRDELNRPLWTRAKQREGEQLKVRLQGIFIRSKVYLNYNETVITVKVDRPSLKDKLEQDAAWKQLEKDCKASNIEIDPTPANIHFRIKL